MSVNHTVWSALGQALAPESSPPVEPEPEADVVEAYSFNTGTSLHFNGSAGLCHAGSLVIMPVSRLHEFFCLGLLVLMMILYASLGHKIAAR